MANEQQHGTPSPRVGGKRVVYTIWVCVAGGWLVADQVTKALAVALLERQAPFGLGVFDLRLIRNPGGAFGIPGAFPGLFVAVTVIVVALVARALPRTDQWPLALAYGLVTGGALGNVVDRIVRAPGFPSGHVVDFIDLRWWPVFNLADVGICVGAGMIVLLLGRAERAERVEREEHGARTGVAAASESQ